MSGKVFDTSEETVIVDSTIVKGGGNLTYLSNGMVVEYTDCTVKNLYIVNDGELTMIYEADQLIVEYPLEVKSLDNENFVYNLSTTFHKDTVLNGNLRVKLLNTPATRSVDSIATYLAHTTYISDSLGLVGNTFFDGQGRLSSTKRLIEVEY